MNRHRKLSGSKRGSALLAALCFCAVLGIALASYMGVCSQTLQLSNRNSQGTHSLELAETGMEDALWALNKGDWSGWTIDNGSSPKTATKILTGFSFGNGVTGTATLTVENYDGSSSLPEYSPELIKLKVVGQTVLADGTTVTRKLQASAQKAPLFVNVAAAVAAANDSSSGNGRNGVTFLAGGTVDSFDTVKTGPYGDLDGDGIPNILDDDMDGDGIPNSADDDIDGDGIPNDFDDNPYGTTSGFSAVVSSTTSVTLTNATINGYVSTAANSSGDARISYSAGARVAGPMTSMSTSIDPSRISTSPYQPVFDIKIPTGTGATLSTVIGNPTATAPTVYFMGDYPYTYSTLTVNGPVILVVSGNFKIDGNGQILVTTTFDGTTGAIVGNGSIQIILTGATSELSVGGHGIQNQTKRPKNVAILDAATSPYNAPEIISTEPLYGVVFAPNSEITVGPDVTSFYGSLIGKSVTISGSPSLHYDVDLRRITTKFSGLETPYAISAWQEIAP